MSTVYNNETRYIRPEGGVILPTEQNHEFCQMRSVGQECLVPSRIATDNLNVYVRPEEGAGLCKRNSFRESCNLSDDSNNRVEVCGSSCHLVEYEVRRFDDMKFPLSRSCDDVGTKV